MRPSAQTNPGRRGWRTARLANHIATNQPSPHASPVSFSIGSSESARQRSPSSDTTTAPDWSASPPTETYNPFPQSAAVRSAEVSDSQRVHPTPSAETRIVPRLPVTT